MRCEYRKGTPALNKEWARTSTAEQYKGKTSMKGCGVLIEAPKGKLVNEGRGGGGQGF